MPLGEEAGRRDRREPVFQADCYQRELAPGIGIAVSPGGGKPTLRETRITVSVRLSQYCVLLESLAARGDVEPC